MYIVCGWILDTEVSLSISTVCTDGEYIDGLKTSVRLYTTGRAQKYAISFIASSLRCYCCMLFFSLSQVHMYTHVFSIFIKWFFFLHTFFFSSTRILNVSLIFLLFRLLLLVHGYEFKCVFCSTVVQFFIELTRFDSLFYLYIYL